jgi:hypothetical protein
MRASGLGFDRWRSMTAADRHAFAANGYRFAKWHGKPNSEKRQ